MLLGLAPERIREIAAMLRCAATLATDRTCRPAGMVPRPNGWSTCCSTRASAACSPGRGAVLRAQTLPVAATRRLDAVTVGARRACAELLDQAARQRWRGPDPYDGLYAAWPSWMTAGRRRRQVIVQAHARSPVDVRRLYRREHPRIAKGLALFGSAATRLAGAPGEDEPVTARARGLALDALEVLNGDHQAGASAWGYPFDVQTRWSFYPAGSPNVVVTAFAIEALLDAAACFAREDFAARAQTAARWVLEELWVGSGGFFAYHPTARVNIHNANLLGALCVHRALGDDPLARERVSRAVERTLGAQAHDGGFPYGEGDGLEWEDSFHTGFVLRCLALLSGIDTAIPQALTTGTQARTCAFSTPTGGLGCGLAAGIRRRRTRLGPGCPRWPLWRAPGSPIKRCCEPSLREPLRLVCEAAMPFRAAIDGVDRRPIICGGAMVTLHSAWPTQQRRFAESASMGARGQRSAEASLTRNNVAIAEGRTRTTRSMWR